MFLQGTEDDIYAIQEEGRDIDSFKMHAGAASDEEYVVLMCVLKHFVSHVKEIDAIIPPCRLVGGAIEIVETCVRFQIERVFRKLRVGTIELLTNAHHQVNHLRQSSRNQSQGSSTTTTSQSVQPAAQEAARTFTDMMQQVLRQMEPLAQTGASILREMSRLFSDLVQVIDPHLFDDSYDPVHSAHSLSLSLLCLSILFLLHVDSILPFFEMVQCFSPDVHGAKTSIRS